MYSSCQSCLWPWVKVLSYFMCFGFQYFCSLMICSFRIWQNKWMLSPEKKSVQKHKCMPSIHGLRLRASALVIYIISPAWVDILNLEKWFTMNTLIQSNKEVWAFVSSCSFLPPGSSTSSGRLLSGPLSFFYHVYQRHYCISWGYSQLLSSVLS